MPESTKTSRQDGEEYETSGEEEDQQQRDDITNLERPSSKRKRRKNVCPYCDKVLTTLSRHLVTAHCDEEEVKQYIELGTESPKKRKYLRATLTNKLRCLGNLKYNRQVVEGERNNQYLPVKYSSHDKHKIDNSTHVNCKHCNGFLKKSSMYKHLGRCPAVPAGFELTKTRSVLPQHSTLLVRDTKCASEMLIRDVFPRMQKDRETIVAQGDRLITKYGSDFRFTHRGTKHVHYCSNRMRTLARLLIAMQESNADLRELCDCIRPKHFDLLVESVRKLSRFDNNTGNTDAPSVPARLCSSLKKCANLMLSDTIKDDTLSRQRKTEIMDELHDFLHLMEKDWASEVSTNSEISRKRQRVMKADLLPDPEDITKFNEFIGELCPLYTETLRHVRTISNYEKLAKLIVAHIIVLSRRRPNETVEITLDTYQKTLNQECDYTEDVAELLTEEEYKSGESLSMFYIAANKNSKKVPVLLTKPFYKATEELIKSRDELGITSGYLFGRAGQPELFDGSVVVRELVNKACLKKPSKFTANSLRHHAATYSQLMVEEDRAKCKEELSKFMGHDLKTHKEFYEMRIPMVQKSRVGHRLLLMSNPKQRKVVAAAPTCTVTSGALETNIQADNLEAGPSDIGTDQNYDYHYEQPEVTIPPADQEEASEAISTSGINDPGCSSWSVTQPTRVTPVKSNVTRLKNRPSKSKSTCSRAKEGVSKPTGTPPSKTPEKETPRVVNRPSILHRTPLPTDTSTPITSDDSCNTPQSNTPPRKVHRKVRWSESEKRVLYERFARYFHRNLRPSRCEIENMWKTETKLRNRTLNQVATYVSNISLGRHRIATPTRKKIKNMVLKNRDKLSP